MQYCRSFDFIKLEFGIPKNNRQSLYPVTLINLNKPKEGCMMTKVFLLFVLVLAVSLTAQEETLVGKEIHSGGYFGPVWKLTSINSQTTSLSGGRAGWLINHKFGIGGAGYGTITDVKSGFNLDTRPLYIELEYGGLELEYIHQSDKMLHWTALVFFGNGTVKLRQHSPDNEVQSDRIYVVEPSLNADVNLVKWFRLGFGASYRYVIGLDLPPLAQSDAGGFAGLICLKFGSF
jgi:hypothetical protein